MFSYIEQIKKEGLLISYLRSMKQIYKFNESLLISCLRSMKQIYKFNESLFILID